ncbi:hypothetical protein D9M69_634150 [compost metagenome]
MREVPAAEGCVSTKMLGFLLPISPVLWLKLGVNILSNEIQEFIGLFMVVVGIGNLKQRSNSQHGPIR